MKFWKRFTRLQAGSKVMSSDDLDIFFKVKGNTDGTADEAEIIIFNLSDATKEQIAPDTPIKLESGYKGDYGTIFLGKVQEWYDEAEGADIKTTLIALSDMSKFTDGSVNKTYPTNSKLTDIGKDQIALAGITNMKVDENIKIFEKAKSYTSATTLKQNLTEIAENLNYDFIERRGSVLLVEKKSGIVEGFVLNSDTGLLSVKKIVQKEDAENKRDFDVQSLLIYRLAQGSIIELDSSISGNKICRVEEIEFVSNENDHVCNIKVKIL